MTVGIALDIRLPLSDYQLSTLPLSFPLTSGYVCVYVSVCVFSCASCLPRCRSAAYATKHNFQLPFSQRVAPFTFEFSPRKGQHTRTRTHTHSEPLYNLAHCLWDKRRCRCRCRCRLRCLLAEKKNVVENCAIVLQFIGERACLT